VLLAARHEDAQQERTPATTADGPAAVRRASTWPRCGVPALSSHDEQSVEPAQYKRDATSRRSPVRGLAALRASSVPRRITCLTRTSLRQRSALFHLPGDQARRHLLPASVAPSTFLFWPCSNMGRERREGEIEPVTGQEGEATGSQERSPGGDDPMCSVVGAGTERKHGKKRACKGREPSRARRTCVAQRSRVRRSSNWRGGRGRWQKDRSCKVCACEPSRDKKARDGGLSKAEHTLGLRGIHPFGKPRDPHPGDVMGRGFQPRQGRVAPGTERGVAGRASQRLHALAMAVLAIANKSRGLGPR
jgi:hypothetical protein